MRHKWEAILSFLIISAFIIIVSTPNVVVSSGWKPEDLEQEVYRLVNHHRSKKGFSGLRWSEEIAKESRIHSRNMASAKIKFSHEGFNARMMRIKKKIDFLRGAENVTFNEKVKDPAREAVETWLKSSGHRANIEDRYDLTGVGVAKSKEGCYYFTQIFIKKRAKEY